MNKIILLVIISLSSFQVLFAQEKIADSTKVDFSIGLRGIMQTGNTEQLIITPNIDLLVYNKNILLEVKSSYSYLKTNGFTVNDDFWNDLILQFKPKKKFYPFITASVGNAQSYKINHFITTGAGIGTHLLNKSNKKYIDFYLYGGYLNVDFDGNPQHESFALGTILRSEIPIKKLMSIQWSFSTYHSTEKSTLWGIRNFTTLNLFLTKQFNVNVQHQLFYNNEEFVAIKKLNTIMMLGLRYKLST